jgi:hypothetical protein
LIDESGQLTETKVDMCDVVVEGVRGGKRDEARMERIRVRRVVNGGEERLMGIGDQSWFKTGFSPEENCAGCVCPMTCQQAREAEGTVGTYQETVL